MRRNGLSRRSSDGATTAGARAGMSAAEVSLLFLVQMGFGSMLTFLLNDREALGPKYFKFSGWVLVALFGLALTLCGDSLLDASASTADRLTAWALVAATLGMLAFSSVAGWDRPRLETAVLVGSTLAAGLVVGAASWSRPPANASDTQRTLTLAGAYGSALTLGFSTWGMILGHWYLVSSDLSIKHLARLVTPLPWIFLGKALVSGLALWLMWSTFLGPGNHSLDDIMARQPQRIIDVVNVWARIPVGLVVPAILAFMTQQTVRMEKTQPATGILYAMCVTVYLGDLLGKMVEGATGVPL